LIPAGGHSNLPAMHPRPEIRPSAAPPYACIVFDCDSTLSSIEGIEELVAGSGEVAERVQALTKDAMEGRVSLESVFGERLRIARPSAEDMALVAKRYVETALPGARPMVRALRLLGKRVIIVSGGLLPAVRPFGEWLGVAPEEIFAVDLRFEPDGSYAGFDATSPLARSGGKYEQLEALGLDGDAALVGDGMTDLEAQPLVARFVAFAGVEARPAVMEQTDACVTAPDFAALVPWLVSEAEIDRLLRQEDPGITELLNRARGLE